MYIRLRPNKSGTTTVYLLDSVRYEGKKHSSSKIVKCFGSSSDQSKIDQLVNDAKALKSSLVSQSVTSRNITHIRESVDVESCKVTEYGIKYVYSHLAKPFFAKLNLPPKYKQTLIDIVLMRIINPVSKLQTAQIASSFDIEGMTTNKIYKMMDSLNDAKIESIKKLVYNNTKELLEDKISVMFYDLTTIYFESNEKSDLKENGFSKDGKSQHVQISLALIVTDYGMPIGYEIFKGNRFEGSTFIPVLTKLKAQYNTSDVTIVADSAMLSSSNMEALIQNGFKFIVSARVRNLSKDLTKQILIKEDYRSLGGENDLSYKSLKLDDNRVLTVAFSEDRKRKDEYDRVKVLEKIRKLEGKSCKVGLRGQLKKPFVKIGQDSVIEIDNDKIEESKMLDGYFGFISNAGLREDEIIKQYKGLWQVEQSFRITKHNLKIRPVYHFVDRRIKAHFAICYLSLGLVRMLEYKLKKANNHVPIESLHRILEEVKAVSLVVGNVKSMIITDIPEEARRVFLALGLKIPQRYLSQSRV